jgi:Dyp-type peroxidase family
MPPAVDPAVAIREIQGNVLHGYGRSLPVATYAAITIGVPDAGRRLLARLLDAVTYASEWHDERPPWALNIAVSHRGLRALGLPQEVLDPFPPEFAEGMASRAADLGDAGRGAPEMWEPELREIELLVVLHGRDPVVLADRERWLRARVGRQPMHLQPAAMLRDRREHFGFADGFGQPAIAEAPSDNDRGQGLPGSRLRPAQRGLAIGEFIHGYRDEDGQAEPLLPPPFARNGTFMVLRKLAQDVNAFDDLLTELADQHYNGDRELVAAKLAGRWRDGTPLMVRPATDRAAETPPAEERNDFDYGSDPKGYVCPIGAHIRRANPRDSLPGGFKRTRRHRLIRRGMPYGAEGEERGLMFVCFNSSIARQFEVVNRWLNDGAPFALGRDADLLTALGENADTLRMSIQGVPPVLVEGRPLVWTRGGEYLLLPSRSALRALAEGVR